MSDQKSPEDYITRVTNLIERVKKAFNDPFWGQRNILKRRANEVKNSIATAESSLDALKDALRYDGKVDDVEDFMNTLSPEETIVFVSVFQFDGRNLLGWEMTLCALDSGSISRPIYSDEEKVKQLVMSKGLSLSEGYVVVKVLKKDILDIHPLDALGQEMTALKRGAVRLENIFRFVHYNQDQYDVKNGKLLKVS